MTNQVLVTATDAFPFIYRFMVTTIEPILAFLGALTVLVDPAQYLGTMTRSTVAYDPQTSFLYTELCGAWLVFAINEAVVLRLVDDRRVWKLLCLGMLASDICYVHSCAQAVGGWAEWVKVQDWLTEDWVVFATTFPPVLTRAAIVLGIGELPTKSKTS